MKASYLLAFALLGGALLAGALLLHTSRRPTPAPVAGSLEQAISSLSDPGADPANRPIPDAKTPTSAATAPAPDAPADPAAERAKSPGASEPSPAAPGEGGMIVVLDPETGGYTAPTPAQARALSGAGLEATSRSDAGLVERIGVGGAIGVDLQGRFQDYATVAIGPDGKKRFGCVHADGHGPACLDSIPAPRALEEQ